MTDAILFDEKDDIVVITINRPEKLNSINQDVRTGLLAAWERFEKTPELKVAILTGAGEKAFCAGMDLKEAADMMLGVPARDFIPIVGDSVTVTKPIIAAVNGLAFAGGWLFAQMCDLCIASENAVFGITEAKVGRGMPWAAPLGNMIPPRVMMELLLTGDPLSAQRALEIGFVNKVVPSAELLPEAILMAKKIAANAPLTVTAAKELVYLSSEMGRSAALRAAYHLFEPVYRSEDALEGPRAFGEKRSPKWQGK
ncbi:enoyl-CoA hydratase-related protein [uncultured Sneathiella sp.]|jgi:enoyl-CoA hydratase/carnithine racemase|uniref:enoyl-CoA hydratase/isomerase family protein n=1 Tax=uncultured Sneathiella sp. TaxID=879315 RepID=UPI0030DB35E0|tara:strand:- start:1028 stop:1792 length:765 start_codon:yes stop_codon:yes gene_type:complete